MTTESRVNTAEVLVEFDNDGRINDCVITGIDGCYAYREKQFARFCQTDHSIVSFRLDDDGDVDAMIALLERMSVGVVHRQGEHYPVPNALRRISIWMDYSSPITIRALYSRCKAVYYRIRDFMAPDELRDCPL